MVNRGWLYLGNLLFNTTTKSKGCVHTGLVFGGNGSWIQRAHHSYDWISTSLLSQGYLHIALGYEPWQRAGLNWRTAVQVPQTWERSGRSHVTTWETVGNDWGWGSGFTSCSHWSWRTWRCKTRRKWRSCLSWLLLDKLCWTWSFFFYICCRTFRHKMTYMNECQP